jgi:hypothetical protein
VLVLIFRFRRQDGQYSLISRIKSFTHECWILEILSRIGVAPEEQGTSDESKYRQIMGNRVVHLLACFVFVYVGCEVTIGGWIVTFVINVRGGGKSSGYVSSGFFGGNVLPLHAPMCSNTYAFECRVDAGPRCPAVGERKGHLPFLKLSLLITSPDAFIFTPNQGRRAARNLPL